jgi:hypothetical protein
MVGRAGMNNRSPIHNQSLGRIAVGLAAFNSATGMPVYAEMEDQLSPRWTT